MSFEPKAVVPHNSKLIAHSQNSTKPENSLATTDFINALSEIYTAHLFLELQD